MSKLEYTTDTIDYRLEYNIRAGLHNHALVMKAEKLINNFIDDDCSVYAINPDGSYIKLQPGVKLTSISGLGIIKEE